MARNPKGKKEDSKPDPIAPESQPQLGAPQPEVPVSDPEIKAEFIGTVQPKYATESKTEAKELAEKAEQMIGTEVKVVYGLAKRHKLIMSGLGVALAISLVVALIFGMGFQSASDKAASLSASYNSVSAQNAQLSSQLSNLSDYRTNFSTLRNRLVTLQSALSNKNITVQDLHYTIASMSQQLSNVSNQINAQNDTIFSLQQQIGNLTRHTNMQYVTSLVRKTYPNLQLNAHGNSGDTFQISFLSNHAGIVVLNVTDPYSSTVTMSDSNGTYYIGNLGSGYNLHVSIPVSGTPSSPRSYTLRLINLAAVGTNGSIGVALDN